MRSADEIERDARPQPAFSNGTIGYGWMANWCDRCPERGVRMLVQPQRVAAEVTG